MQLRRSMHIMAQLQLQESITMHGVTSVIVLGVHVPSVRGVEGVAVGATAASVSVVQLLQYDHQWVMAGSGTVDVICMVHHSWVHVRHCL